MHLHADDDLPGPGLALDQVGAVVADARGKMRNQMVGDGVSRGVCRVGHVFFLPLQCCTDKLICFPINCHGRT